MRLLIFLFALLIISYSSIPAFAQQLSIGKEAQQKIEVSINEENEVHVKHTVDRSMLPQSLDVINGTLSNLLVTNINGDEKDFAKIQKEPLGITIFPSQSDTIVEYDLQDALILKDGRWTWDRFVYINSITFHFPNYLDIVFVNSNPIVREGSSITCHGCEMILEYIVDEPKISKNVNWKNRNFPVIIRTLAEVNSFEFNQPAKRISFDLESNNDLVTVIIPLELLWEPYDIIFNEEERLLRHAFFTNETHAGINFRLESSGKIEIIGTTVIPEFPLFVPLALGISIIIGLQLKNRLTLR